MNNATTKQATVKLTAAQQEAAHKLAAALAFFNGTGVL